MKITVLFLTSFFSIVVGNLLLRKNDIKVSIGREVYLMPDDLLFQNVSGNICKVEVVSNEPMTQRVGLLDPQIFDCNFNFGSVKYVHHGSPLLSNDTVKLRAYKFLKHDTVSEYIDLVFIIENSSYNVIQPVLPLIIKDFFGLSDPIDENILTFNFSRNEGAICKIRMSRHIGHRPSHGQIVIGREKRSIDVIKRRCDDFLHLGLRYEHLKPPSPNIDFVLIIVEVSDPYLNNGDLISEWYHIPVLILPGFPNLPPKASFSSMYLMDVDQFIITAITPGVLSATDSETPADQLIFNISKPLLPHQGSIVHLSDHTRAISSFRQKDLNNFDIAYKPPSRSFKDRQMFEIGFVISDPDFSYSEPFTMHVAIRPAITTAPRVSMNVGMVLLEGQSRPLRLKNFEVVDSDNINDIQIFVTGGLHHGKLEVNNKPSVSFMQQDIVSESVVYIHDDSDSTRDSIHFRIYDGTQSTFVKFPITIIPKDDNPPSLIINIGLKVNEGGEVQITPSSLRAVDHDSTDEHVSFTLIKQPSSGKVWKKFSWEKIGTDILTFTQRDINKGLIYYHHDGSEVAFDNFAVILQDVNNPPNSSPPFKVLVRVIPVGDDPPKRDPASSFNIEVQETDFGVLGSQHLCYMDIDSLASEITYAIITYPRFIGSLAHADPGKVVLFSDGADLEKENNWTSVNTFTQEQINHHKIAYVPPNDEIGPNPLYLQFIFSVTDKDNNVVPGQVFNITILPVNNKVPQLHTGELLVEEGSSTLLSTNELSVYDPDTLTSDLQMSLFTIPLHGSLRRSEQPLRVGDLLSLDDILTLRLEYVHDGSESFKDGFKVGVNDGLHFVSGIVRVSIEPVDDEKPVWKKDLVPRISVNEGGKVLLTPQFPMKLLYHLGKEHLLQKFSATDIDTDDSSLFFILTEAPLFGSIVLEKHKVNRFTQSNVLVGEVAYMHNGQEIGPSPKEDALTFIVTDKLFPRSISHDSHRVFVTILPQNDRPPRLYFKRAILVEEGHKSVITDENLSATDDDTFASELLIVITKQPEYGYLENSRPTPGYEQNDGKKINAFPLQDVKNGFITFVQFNHSNVEPESDGFEVFVTDGVHNSTSVLVFVSIVLLNDELPIFFISNITLDEGGSFVMNNSSVVATDRDFPGDILIITVKAKPHYGTLTHFVQAVNNGPLLEIPFTQLSFENFESIVYRHDGSENFKDSFALILSDGLHNVLKTCFIEINPVNDEAPFIVKNMPAKNVELLGSFILSNAVLLADDIDTTSADLFFKITEPPTQGILEQKNEKGYWVMLDPLEFSQEEINLNLIRYRQTDENIELYEDAFIFIVSDGVHESVPAAYSIKLVARGKSIMNVLSKGIVVEHGSEVILNSSVLYAFDNSSKIEDIVFYVMKIPTYGDLILNSNSSHPVRNFSISDIINNHLSYKHNESFKVTSDSFDLMITNGVAVANITFDVAISSLVIKIPILEIVLPLSSDQQNSDTYIITSEHLLSYQPGKNDSKIIYEIIDAPKFGAILHSGEILNPIIFSQEDINKGLVSYLTNSNSSVNDQFTFKVTNNEEDGYLFGGKLMLKPTLFQIFLKSAPQMAEPSMLIRSPTDLENVWNHLTGFFINNYNLKVTFSDASASEIRYYVTKYLQHGYIFNVKEEKFVRSFTQEDINEQQIVVVLKQGVETFDYFLFHVAIKQVTFNKEYRMDFQWAAVFFPYLEYSVCEDAAALNIVIHRKGNLDISSYVTISAVEQTAREGLDFVSRYVNKIQFDPGISEVLWKIIIVQDDLEEAPIEQLQVVLSESENCMISYQNRTIVSIYDLNRGSCSQIPIIRPETHKEETKSLLKVSEKPEFENNENVFDGDEEGINDSAFPMECNQDIYGLLHFKQSTQSLFQCDGKKWLPWYSNKSNVSNNHSLGIPHIDDNERIENKLDNITETSVSEEQESTTLVPENCPKGWLEFIGKCHKWQRQPITWNAAKEVCESFPSSRLVVIESLEHNNWLLQLARGKPFWIGLHMSIESSDWKYTGQNDVSFFNWKKGFPRLPQSGEVKHRCVLVRGSGQWINKNCEFHDHSFICVMPKSLSAVVGDLQ